MMGKNIKGIKSAKDIPLKVGFKGLKRDLIIFSGGFSLVEMLVVVLVFSILAIVATQSLILSLRGAKKSESLIEVKSNIDYAVSTVERLLRNAQAITSCTNTQIDYLDENNRPGRFRCAGSNCTTSDCYIASGSANIRLTSNQVRVMCQDTTPPPFQCPPPAGSAPSSIIINLRARHSSLGVGVEGAEVTTSTKILLRTY